MTAELGTLLVVDDDELNRDMLSRRLERKGYSVAVGPDGPGASLWSRIGRSTWSCSTS